MNNQRLPGPRESDGRPQNRFPVPDAASFSSLYTNQSHQLPSTPDSSQQGIAEPARPPDGLHPYLLTAYRTPPTPVPRRGERSPPEPQTLPSVTHERPSSSPLHQSFLPSSQNGSFQQSCRSPDTSHRYRHSQLSSPLLVSYPVSDRLSSISDADFTDLSSQLAKWAESTQTANAVSEPTISSQHSACDPRADASVNYHGPSVSPGAPPLLARPPVDFRGGDVYETGSHLCDYHQSTFGEQLQASLASSPQFDPRSLHTDSRGTKRKRESGVSGDVGSRQEPVSQESCVKCRMLHKKCEDGLQPRSCVGCFKKSIYRCLCSRVRLSDATLFRTRAGPVMHGLLGARQSMLEQLLDVVTDSQLATTTLIQLQQVYGATFQLKVCQFEVPDELYRDMSASERKLFAHQYKLADRKATSEGLEMFVKDSVKRCLTYKLAGADSLTRGVFRFATILAEEQNTNQETEPVFLSEVLQFWTAARLIEGGWKINGPETLGLRGQPQLPDAPAIDEQFAVLLRDKILLPLRDKIVKGLDNIITHQRKARWIELVLAVFIILHHYSLVMQHQWDFSRSHRCQNRYTAKEFTNQLHAGARNLLIHFHVVCGGRMPFKQSWHHGQPQTEKIGKLRAEPELKKLTTLKEREDIFMCRLIEEVERRMTLFENLTRTERYEAPHWFTGQMFVRGWRPVDIPAHNDLPAEILSRGIVQA